MKLRTSLAPPVFDFKLDYNSKVITLGSCFSDVIGDCLQQRKFSVKSNPFGTVYNLKSVCDVVGNAIYNILPEESRIVSRDDLFFYLDYHSEFYSHTPEGLMDSVRAAGKDFREHLLQADLLIITLGTSWVYKFEEETVSCCHKLPASRFEKHLLDLDDQRGWLNIVVENLQKFNPHLKLMFAVSPVRHIKDGISENSLSKAILRSLCDEAVKDYPRTCYFPSFEVMMDDLRDYRFYKPDLIHPNEVAEDYICGLFLESVLTDEARRVSEEWNQVRKALEHRPLNPGSESHRAFLTNLLAKTKTFSPFFDVSKECELVERRLEEFFLPNPDRNSAGV